MQEGPVLFPSLTTSPYCISGTGCKFGAGGRKRTMEITTFVIPVPSRFISSNSHSICAFFYKMLLRVTSIWLWQSPMVPSHRSQALLLVISSEGLSQLFRWQWPFCLRAQHLPWTMRQRRQHPLLCLKDSDSQQDPLSTVTIHTQPRLLAILSTIIVWGRTWRDHSGFTKAAMSSAGEEAAACVLVLWGALGRHGRCCLWSSAPCLSPPIPCLDGG